MNSDCVVQPCRLSSLASPRLGETFHRLIERLVIILYVRGTHIPPRREHVTVLSDIVEVRGHAEPWHVGVVARFLVTPPGVISPSNLRYIVIRQLTMHPVG